MKNSMLHTRDISGQTTDVTDPSGGDVPGTTYMFCGTQAVKGGWTTTTPFDNLTGWAADKVTATVAIKAVPCPPHQLINR